MNGKDGFSWDEIAHLSLVSMLILAAVIISAPPAGAQSTCCVSETSGCSTATQLVCETQLDGEYRNQSCSAIAECTTQGCCCINNFGPNVQGEYMIQAMCSASFQPSASNQCASACNTNIILISGQVTYSGGGPAQARVTIYNYTQPNSVVQVNQQTDSQGRYSLYVPANKQYVVTASAGGTNCIVTQIVPPSNGPVTANLQFPASCAPTTACTMQWQTAWLDPSRQCGARVVTLLNPTCNSGNPPRPPSFVPCPPASTSRCVADGIVQTSNGEQCDPAVPPRFNGRTCADFGYSSGSLSCTGQCLIDPVNCYNCPSTIAGCTQQSMCTNCAVCSTAPLCSNTCANPSITAVATPTTSTRGFNVSWMTANLACSQAVQYYKVTRCEGDAAGKCKSNTYVDVAQQLPPDRFSLTDASFTGQATKYCYNVSARIVSGSLNAFVSSGLTCASFANPLCVGKAPDEWFCYRDAQANRDARGMCDASGQLIESLACEAAERCMGPDSNGAVWCQSTAICDACSGPYGLFSYEPMDLDQRHALDPAIISCDEAISNNICYDDDYSLKRSLIGQAKACADVASCYAYRTETSCEQNPCTVAAASGCSWNSYTGNEELGLGVCVPDDVEEQDCTQCNKNSMLGGYCPRQLCQIYGDSGRCYFNAIANVSSNDMYRAVNEYTCMNVEDVACETYDTQAECAESRQYTVDISYNGGQKSGSHAVRSYSDDAVGLGRCKWVTENLVGSCIRDSDNNITANPGSYDCKRPFTKGCLTDMESPTTTVSISDGNSYSKAELIGLSFTAEDNVFSGADIGTFFKIRPGIIPRGGYSGNDYPNETLRRLNADYPPGTYTLLYYSLDKASNHEPIRTETFTLIPDLRDVRVTWSMESVYNNIDMFLTNLTVRVLYPTQLSCEARLRNVIAPNISLYGDGIKTTPSLAWSYNYLTDGTYRLNTRCWDGHAQLFTNQSDIVIEADTSIKNPRPRGRTFRAGSVQIGIETLYDAACEYTNDPAYVPPRPGESGLDQGFDPGQFTWTRYQSTGMKNHTSNVTKTATGMEFYNSRCRFANGTMYYGNDGDTIYFAVDAEPPGILVLNDASGEAYNSSLPLESVRLRFPCTDYASLLEYAGANYSFGCDSMRYCEYYAPIGTQGIPPAACTPTAALRNLPWTVQFSTPLVPRNTYLNILVNDTGGNEMDTRILVNVKNVSMILPNITICDPETGTCS